MVIIRKSVYYRSVFYAFLMIVYGILGYLFLDSGFNTKTKVYVNYEDSSDIYYKINYKDLEYEIEDTGRYISNMVDSIDINFNYNNILSEYVSGYYKYDVMGYLIAYEDDITDSLWERKYTLLSENSVILNKNNLNNIKIEDGFNIDFNKYREEIYQFADNYDISLSGYLHIRINIREFLNFNGLNNEYADNKVITINIPLTNDIFRIDVNNLNNKDSYYDFSSNKPMNIVFLIIGAFCVSLAISSLVMVIRQFKIIYNRQSVYKKELKRIISKYDNCIVKVKKFYVNKKYNMIYVDSFDELMDVYNNKSQMISFKEVKRDSESIFVIIDGDDAWIYRLM